MMTDKFEDKIGANAEEVFGAKVPLPHGHRERFAARLKEENRHRAIALDVVWYSLGAIAAVFVGILLLLNPFGRNGGDEVRVDDVRNYYAMKLEERADAMKQTIENSNRPDKEILLQNIREIEEEPFPDIQMTDEDRIVLIADIYGTRMEVLDNMWELVDDE